MTPPLQDTNAPARRGGGVIGGGVACAFAREGAEVSRAGHKPAKLDGLAG